MVSKSTKRKWRRRSEEERILQGWVIYFFPTIKEVRIKNIIDGFYRASPIASEIKDAKKHIKHIHAYFWKTNHA